MLIHRLPPKPDYLRVKVLRRLRRVGARALKNTVYLLPNTDEALEDFSWLRREIESEGGEATICEVRFVDGMSNAGVAAMWRDSGGHPSGIVDRDRGDQVPRGTTWVTRSGVAVDRMASAWLIRRFIDPDARFKFAPPRGYRPAAGELRFDMYDGDYSHEGDDCTFETLVRRFALDDPALRPLAELVHDIDCKDGKFGRGEASGIALVVDSIRQGTSDDAARLERGGALFDALYERWRAGAVA